MVVLAKPSSSAWKRLHRRTAQVLETIFEEVSPLVPNELQRDGAFAQMEEFEPTKANATSNVREIVELILNTLDHPLTEQLQAIPIDAIQRLEDIVHFIYKKAIDEQNLAPHYAELCLTIQKNQENSGGGEAITSFKTILIRRCQSEFEALRSRHIDFLKKLVDINVCDEPETKKELEVEYEVNKRRTRQLSVGTCRFIGELFLKNIIHVDIIVYCIVNLIAVNEEEPPLECLWNLLNVVGKKLDQTHNLNELFDRLLKYKNTTFSSRIQFIIKDTINLRRNKWKRDGPKRKIYCNDIVAKIGASEQNLNEESYRTENPLHRHGGGEENELSGVENKGDREIDNEWIVDGNTEDKQRNYTIDKAKLQYIKEIKRDEKSFDRNSEIEDVEEIKKCVETSQHTIETQGNEVTPEVVIDQAQKIPSYLLNLPYEEGQWSVTDRNGEKKYSIAFLTQLGNENVCKKKPDVLRAWGCITKINSPPLNKLGKNRSQRVSATPTMPACFKFRNSSSRNSPLLTGSKQNICQEKNASKTLNTIHMSLSQTDDVKLNRTQNPWVPTTVTKSTKVDVKNEEEFKSENVYKSVRSVLNKITPENIDQLTDQFRSLPINSYERLEKVIDLVFQKAIEEQSFAPLYATLCRAMQTVQVSSNEGNKIISYRDLIVSKCKHLFESDQISEMDCAKKFAKMNSCKNPEEKNQLKLEYEEIERRLRKRSVGNCRFIGELFKVKILKPNVMLRCVDHLIDKHQQESLECLCNLLQTIGNELEQTHNLSEHFQKLKSLISKGTKTSIPSRIRFMIMDVIDLRQNNWVSRRPENH